MPLLPTIWHFHRKADARKYIDFFETGISNSITLFAPRRRGKTALLLHDVRPMALTAGYNVIYCTFWDNKERPAQALMTAIEDAGKPVSLSERLIQTFNIPVKDISVAFADIKLSVKLDAPNDSENDILHKLSNAFRDIANSRKRTLFLMDEIQHLATDEKFSSLVATIRSAFDKYPEKLCALYTGSSREGLHQLFKEKKSPLFNAAQEYPLPEMKSDFIAFVLDKFEQASGRTIPLADGLKVWKSVQHSPYDFMAIVEKMLTNIESNMIEACEDYLEKQKNDPALAKMVSEMKPIDKLLVLKIGDEQRQFYSEQFLSTLSEEMGVNVSKSDVQNSLRRLRDKELVTKVSSGYEIENSFLIDYLKKQAER